MQYFHSTFIFIRFSPTFEYFRFLNNHCLNLDELFSSNFLTAYDVNQRTKSEVRLENEKQKEAEEHDKEIKVLFNYNFSIIFFI